MRVEGVSFSTFIEKFFVLRVKMPEIVPLEWTGEALRILDQTKLPQEQAVILARTYDDVIRAISTMQIRGAPAIGVAGAYAVLLAARSLDIPDIRKASSFLSEVGDQIGNTRPTAVNLRWAVERMLRVALTGRSVRELNQILEAEAVAIHREDVAGNRKIGILGAELIPENCMILTHCNAGALATGGYGTALGVIRAAWEQGKKFRMLITETRPLLQGSRLTAWELVQLGIPTDLVVDSAAGTMMAHGEVGAVIVGADRIAANGDVANKIGTYTLAVLACENKIPFYVAAPMSTVDLSLPSGDEITIEERGSEEVTILGGKSIIPKGINVRNPAFDVTPHRYVAAIITERGIVNPPYQDELPLLNDEKSFEMSSMTLDELKGATGA
jgi:methylthioribose-1-phosphate isomerase